jgi:uncharacterized SAM-binding protein YcdF (DUF218 family)
MLEGWYPPLLERPQDVQATVVLSGGRAGSLYRCARAVQLYRMGKPCPVLFSCSPDEAKLLRDNLLQLGVREEDLVEEAGSGNTFENATHSRVLLSRLHLSKVALVTDAAHLPRAAACFRGQGIEVVPAAHPSDRSAPHSSLLDYLPNADGACQSRYAAQEWLGMAWYWLRGRL